MTVRVAGDVCPSQCRSAVGMSVAAAIVACANGYIYIYIYVYTHMYTYLCINRLVQITSKPVCELVSMGRTNAVCFCPRDGLRVTPAEAPARRSARHAPAHRRPNLRRRTSGWLMDPHGDLFLDFHGFCWETFCIFAYCGLVGNFH